MRIRRSARGWFNAWRQTKPIFRDLRKLTLVAALLVGLTITIFAVRSTFATPPCPCTAFTINQPASDPSVFNEVGGIELGIKMRFDHAGYISGIRFYKSPGMGGVHSGSLWSNDGSVRMANATFVNETASGWQEVQFAPVAVAANTIYTASVFMADGNYVATPHYFGSPVINAPFTLPDQGSAIDGLGNVGQGAYAAAATSTYPTHSFNETNYWIDATYVSSADTAPPTITAQTPADDATNVEYTDAVTATFDKLLDPASVSSSTILVTDDQNQPVAGTVTYDSATRKVQFVPDVIWASGKTYTVTLKGSSPAIQDYDGHDMAADYSWSFTVTTTPLDCPCSLKNNQIPTGSSTYREDLAQGIELGLKIVPRMNGYITGVRFYKPIVNTATMHTGHVWDSQGNLLASATTIGESEYGWQEAVLTTPLSVNSGQVYVVSFGLATGDYQATFGQFTAPMTAPGFVAYPGGDARNTASGSGTANSVYTYVAGQYPGSPSTNNYYHIDAVFSGYEEDQLPLQVIKAEPTNGSYAVKRSTPIRLTFDQPINPATVTTANVQLRDGNNQLVARSVSFNQAKRAVTITPTVTLAENTRYDVVVTPGVTDTRGLSLGQDYSWSFTTGATTAAVDVNQGIGGPVLIVTAPGDTYGKYYAEILRAEGISYFTVKDTSELSANLLNQYTTVIAAQASLSQPQVDTLQNWVQGGGNLIAMRPDKKLASVLGLTDANATSLNQYMRVDPATAAGAGIVSQSMQYKGTADRYTLNGATAVAQLYSDASTATAFPAVTTRTVGAGTASSFSYDLARSVIALHQGNVAWSGQDRNADGPIRTNDLFFGAKSGDVQPDWLDVNKMAIPQADEQQRLLVNIMTEVTKNTLPMPRFWYLPNDQKAALVLAGDDHGLNDATGTRQQMNSWLNQSPLDCSMTDWQCVRASHYVYVNSGLTNAQAVQLAGYGFEIGNHPVNSGGQCYNDANYAELYPKYAASMATWNAKFTGVAPSISSRYHCYSWADWDMMPRAGQAQGVRYDLNTVAFPASWINSRSPMVTGSGMNMRLTDLSGALLDVHQGVTNFDNTSADSTSIAAILDNAVGVNGYYGMFGSHYDMEAGETYHQLLVDLAKSRGVPTITAAQALEWLTSREQSSFTQLSRPTTGQLTFRLIASEGAHGLRAMVPAQNSGGTVASLTRGGQTVAYQTQTIKGVSYAVFEGRTGDYDVRYSNYSPSNPPTGDEESTPGAGSTGGTSGTSSGKTVARSASINQQPATDSSDEAVAIDTDPSTDLGVHIVHDDQVIKTPEPTISETPWYGQSGVWWAIGGGVVILVGSIWWILAIIRRRSIGL
ncbi:MAG TPA: DUF4082 domain-containing protein [Candidatus Saccharimonadales bacterium]